MTHGELHEQRCSAVDDTALRQITQQAETENLVCAK